MELCKLKYCLMHSLIDLLSLSLMFAGFHHESRQFYLHTYKSQLPSRMSSLCSPYQNSVKLSSGLTGDTFWTAAESLVEAFSVHARLMSSFEDGCVLGYLGESLCVPCAHWCGATEVMSGRAGHCVCSGAAVKICSVCVCAASGWQARARHYQGTCMCVVMVVVMCVVGGRIQV